MATNSRRLAASQPRSQFHFRSLATASDAKTQVCISVCCLLLKAYHSSIDNKKWNLLTAMAHKPGERSLAAPFAVPSKMYEFVDLTEANIWQADVCCVVLSSFSQEHRKSVFRLYICMCMCMQLSKTQIFRMHKAIDGSPVALIDRHPGPIYPASHAISLRCQPNASPSEYASLTSKIYI